MEFTQLSTGQVFNEPIELIKRRGRTFEISDFAVALGGYGYKFVHSNKGMIGKYWLINLDNEVYNAYAVDTGGYLVYGKYGQRHNISVLPVFKYNELSELPLEKTNKTEDGFIELEYGEYPKQAVLKSEQALLEQLYFTNNLEETNQIYTVPYLNKNNLKEPELIKYNIYKYNDEKYIRLIVNTGLKITDTKLSNGIIYKTGDIVWIKVEQIKWIIDAKAKLMISEMMLFSGIPFSKGKYNGNFDESYIKYFFDNYVEKELNQSKNKILIK